MKKIDRRPDKPKKEFDFLESEFYKFCSSKFLSLYVAITIFNVLLIILQLNALTHVFIVIGIVLVDILFYLLFKNECSNSKQKIGYYLFKINLSFMVTLITNQFLVPYIYQYSPNAAKIVGIVFALGIFIGFLAIYTQKLINEQIAVIQEFDIREYIESAKAEDVKIEPGDAIIGYEVDMSGNKPKVTNKPVILPTKDRYLHSLIIGPTGSGKTSQVLIPMIYRSVKDYSLVQGKKSSVFVLEPKADLAEKVYAMVNYQNQIVAEAKANGTYSEVEHGIEREVMYFNPVLKGCPYFNPLVGEESDVIENMCTTFNMLNADSPQFFKDMTDGLVRRAVKLLKRLHGDEGTLVDLNNIVWNVSDIGMKEYIMKLKRKTLHPSGRPFTEEEKRENEELIDWFIRDYYSGIGGAKGAPKTYENTSGVRTQISKLVSNEYLKKVLNPPKKCNMGEPGYAEYLESLNVGRINFDEALDVGYVLTMTTANGKLRDLGRFLGYFLMLQIQSSVFRRSGNENTRNPCYLFIDEFQVYSNTGFSDMLTQGRSYRVACHLATQARAQIGMGNGRDGKDFVELVSTNARNKIIYPGISYVDAKYYSEEFGSEMVTKEDRSFNQSAYFGSMNGMKMTTKETSKLETRFSPTDIMDRPFGQVTCRLIAHNSVQPPCVAQISYIPYEVNKKLDEMIAEDNAKRAIDPSALTEIKNATNEEINTAPVDPIFDNKDDFMKEEFTFDLSEADIREEARKEDVGRPTPTLDTKKEDVTDFFANGSPLPPRPSIETPKYSEVNRPKYDVEFLDPDGFIDLD